MIHPCWVGCRVVLCWNLCTTKHTITTCTFSAVCTASTYPINSYLGPKKSWDFLSSWLSISLHSDDGKWSKNGPKTAILLDGSFIKKPLFSLHVLIGPSSLWIFMRTPVWQTAVGVVDTPTAKQGIHSHDYISRKVCERSWKVKLKKNNLWVKVIRFDLVLQDNLRCHYIIVIKHGLGHALWEFEDGWPCIDGGTVAAAGRQCRTTII